MASQERDTRDHNFQNVALTIPNKREGYFGQGTEQN